MLHGWSRCALTWTVTTSRASASLVPCRYPIAPPPLGALRLIHAENNIGGNMRFYVSGLGTQVIGRRQIEMYSRLVRAPSSQTLGSISILEEKSCSLNGFKQKHYAGMHTCAIRRFGSPVAGQAFCPQDNQVKPHEARRV